MNARYEPIVVDGRALTAAYVSSLSIDEREAIVQYLLRYFRSTGFPFPSESPETIVDDFATLCETRLAWEDGLVDSRNLAGSRIFHHFYPHFYACGERNRPSMLASFSDDTVLLRVLRNRMQVTFSEAFHVHGAMIRQGFRSMRLAPNTTSFRATVAKAIYDKYLPDGGVTFDCSAGFGQRMLGFAASNQGGPVSRGCAYIGVDPWGAQVQSGLEVRDFLGLVSTSLYEAGSESFTPPCGVDLVFSSPPYFSTEIYGGNGQSIVNADGSRRSMGEWLTSYWSPTVSRFVQALSPGGRVILNLGQKVADPMLQVCQEHGLVLVETLGMRLSTSHFSGKKASGKVESTEPIYVLTKSPS